MTAVWAEAAPMSVLKPARFSKAAMKSRVSGLSESRSSDVVMMMPSAASPAISMNFSES